MSIIPFVIRKDRHTMYFALYILCKHRRKSDIFYTILFLYILLTKKDHKQKPSLRNKFSILVSLWCPAVIFKWQANIVRLKYNIVKLKSQYSVTYLWKI